MILLKIAVIPNNKTEKLQETASEVVRILTAAGAVVLLPEGDQPFGEQNDACIEACDAVVALGGDGTMLHIAKRAAVYGKPILGINCGHLGFMTDLEADELDLLPQLLTGDYTVEERMMLCVSVNGGEPMTALNELALCRNALMPPVTVCVKNGETKVIEYQGDGVLLATSTGSTGYSLSAGGPVVDPSMDALLLTPLCPHTLTARSYIFRPESVLTLTVPNAEKESVYYAVDGRSGQPLTPADTLTVYRSPQKARFLHIKHREFYDVLRHKIINRNE